MLTYIYLFYIVISPKIEGPKMIFEYELETNYKKILLLIFINMNSINQI